MRDDFSSPRCAEMGMCDYSGCDYLEALTIFCVFSEKYYSTRILRIISSLETFFYLKNKANKINFSCKMADELQEWMRKSTLKMESVPKGRKSRKSTKKMSEFRNLLSESDLKISNFKMPNHIIY